MDASEEKGLSWAKGVPAPRDADGLEIPLDVDALYDKNGNRVAVSRWSYVRGRDNAWTFNLLFEYPDVPHYPQDYHLSKPDSLERLLKDLERPTEGGDKFFSVACAYVDNSGNTCGDCKLRESRGACSRGMLEDIASRIRKLRGDAE